MDYADYARQISFRLLQPDRPRPAGFHALNRLARRAGFHLEMWMTALPEDQETMRQRLANLCRMRRRSTFAVGALINRGIDQVSPGQAFLSLGVGAGFPLLAGMAGHAECRCIGVDSFLHRPRTRRRFLARFERYKSGRHEFHEQDFRGYLSGAHRGPVGFLACTGMACCSDQYDALRLAEPFFADGSCILLEDANEPGIRRAAENFLSASVFEYRTLLDVRTPRSGHPTFANGVLLFQRVLAKAVVAGQPDALRRAA